MFALLGMGMTGCGTLQQGTRVKIATTGFSLYRSWLTIHNDAPRTTAKPLYRGNGIISEYTAGKRDPKSLWLGREKLNQKAVMLSFGNHYSLPLPWNGTGQYRRETLSLEIKKAGKFIGTYTCYVDVPPDRDVSVDIHFGKRELHYVETQGYLSEQCGKTGWGWGW